jgi:threonine dehydrogenase-like Zn-dependent dehydrogenase
VEQEDLEATVTAVTGGMGVDVSIDTAGGPATLASVMKLTRKNGAVLFAAAPPGTPEGFNVNDLLVRRLTLKPCRGHSYEAVELALRYIASKRPPFAPSGDASVRIGYVDLAVRSVGGQGAPGAVHVTVTPWI